MDDAPQQAPGEDFDPTQYILRRRRMIRYNAGQAQEANPDEAVRADELSHATGVDPSLITTNIDEFERQHRAKVTAEILKRNPALQEYASDPISAKISNDDWGQLDALTEKAKTFEDRTSGAQGVFFKHAALSALPAVGSLPAMGMGAELGAMFGASVGGPAAPITGFLGGVLGAGVGGFLGVSALGKVQEWLLSKAPEDWLKAFGVDPASIQADITAHPTAAFAGGMAPFALTMKPTGASIVARGMSAAATGMFEAGQELVQQGKLSPEHVAMAAIFGAVFAQPNLIGEKLIGEGYTRAQQFVKAVDPYVRAGKEPPVGVNSDVDKIKANEAENDLKVFDETVAEAQKTNTIDRSKDHVAKALSQVVKGDIGISFGAVKKLYGDTVPTADDGKLGWIPRLAEQMADAEVTGADIVVPKTEWLAKIDPALHRELHDSLRLRPEGLTKEEAGELKTEEKPVVEGAAQDPTQQAVDGIRQSSGMAVTPGFEKWAKPEEPPLGVQVGGSEATAKGHEGKVETAKPLFTTTVSEALKNIKLEHLSPVTRTIHNLVGDKLDQYVGQVPIKVLTHADTQRLYGVNAAIKGEEVAAYWEPNVREIGISYDHLGHPRALSRYVVHEAIHAFTSEAMYHSPDLMAKIDVIRQTYDKHLAENFPHARGAFDYAFKNSHEFMAEALSNPKFAEVLSAEKAPDTLVKALGYEVGGRIKTYWDAFKELVREAIQKAYGVKVEPSYMDLVLEMMKEVEQFNKETVRGSKQRPAMGAKPTDEQEAFKVKAVEHSARYEELTEKQRAEDMKAAADRALREAKKRQTEEWKINERRERSEATAEIDLRPDIVADRNLRGKVKIDPSTLTPEQRAMLPKEYFAKDGVSADEVAGAFGYPTGDAMVNHLALLEKQRKDSGLRPELLKRKLITDETERRMREKYGDLNENILADAKDQVLSETEMTKLHEDLVKTGYEEGWEYPISKEQLQASARDHVRDAPIGQVSSDRFLAAAGRAAAAIEKHLLEKGLKGLTEAFREKQRKTMAIFAAREAMKVEKVKEGVEKLAKRYNRSMKDLKNRVLPEYVNFIQDTFQRLGMHSRRAEQDIRDDIVAEGYTSLDDFVKHKESTNEVQRQDLFAPDWLLNPNFHKPFEQLTAGELDELNSFLKSMDKHGREENKVIKAGEKQEINDAIDEMEKTVESVKGEVPERQPDRPPGKLANVAKSSWWSMVTVTSVLNRLDGGKWGIFHELILRPIMEGSSYKDRLLREFQAKLNEVGFSSKELDKLMPNTLFKDPNTGEPWVMRKRNYLGILAYAGNKSSLTKLAHGYGLEPEEVMTWIHTWATKEDWDRMQKVGIIFGELFDAANTMSHHENGTGIPKLPLEPIVTPHGTYEGWYNPVKYDRRFGTSRKLAGPSLDDESGYYRATTGQGYTKERTRYVAPVELNMDIIPIRMKQMIHDIAMRPAINQAAKFFYNRRFQTMIRNHMGEHVEALLIPYLRDIAGSANFQSLSEHYSALGLEYLRQNLISTLIGFNPGTVMKHGLTALVNSTNQVGLMNWAREFSTLHMESPEAGLSNWQYAMKYSEELQRRVRGNFQELFTGKGQELRLRGSSGRFEFVRDLMIKAGATPVSISDLLSSVPTWLAEHKRLLAEGVDKGHAIIQANDAVVQAHGSSALTNRPAVMRSNAMGSYFTSLYGFFSHMLQKQYELAWRAKDTYGLAKEGEYAKAMAEVPKLATMLVSYVIIPAIVEELVSPYSNEKRESWGVKAAKTLGLGISSSFVGVRDFAHGLMGGRGGEAGLAGTGLETLSNVARDISKGRATFTKEHTGKLIRDTTTLTGVLTGVTNAQEGKVGQYLYNYFHGKERPKGPWDVSVGLRYGKTDKHAHTFENWLKEQGK